MILSELIRHYVVPKLMNHAQVGFQWGYWSITHCIQLNKCLLSFVAQKHKFDSNPNISEETVTLTSVTQKCTEHFSCHVASCEVWLKQHTLCGIKITQHK